MSQGPFNPDFTDKDADRLCEIASIANDPQYRYYTCGWVTGQVICSSFVQVADFPDHLRSHGLVGSEQTKVKCCWVSCSADMKKESLVRHVNEKHLELRSTLSTERHCLTDVYVEIQSLKDSDVGMVMIFGLA
ncbi:hypothetical protein OG21DRAFT_1481648 [Imleria badia]|nr:hypothetical protein OG21DRAFT_1481648 [Imleria badia]